MLYSHLKKSEALWMVSQSTCSRQLSFLRQLESPLQCEKELLFGIRKQEQQCGQLYPLPVNLALPTLKLLMITLFLNGFKWLNLHACNWSLTHITQELFIFVHSQPICNDLVIFCLFFPSLIWIINCFRPSKIDCCMSAKRRRGSYITMILNKVEE